MRPVLVAFALILALQPAAAQAKQGKLASYSLTVSYGAPVCGVEQPMRLDSAGLVFLRDGKPISHKAKSLSENGTATFKLSHRGAEAYARLSGNGAVILARDADAHLPDPLHDGRAYIDLGKIKPGRSRVHISSEADDRAANAWSQIQQNLRFATPISPHPLTHLPIQLDYDNDVSEYSTPKHKLFLTKDGAFDDFGAIAHEFGHYVMFSNIIDAPHQGGIHQVGETYPDRPGLAFYEGWAWTYAAAEQHTSHWTLIAEGCKKFVDLAADVPTFQIDHPHYAQFNEEAAAYVMYHLANYLGDGDITKGVAAVLHAYATHKVGGHDVETMHDFRDALIEDGTDQDSADRDDDINAIFGQYGMSWGIQVRLTHANEDDGSLAFNSTTVHVTGPGGFDCIKPTDDHQRPTSDAEGPGFIGSWTGPLKYTWKDDCVVDGGPDEGTDNGAYQRSFPDAFFALELPYEAGSEEQGAYTVMVTFTCHSASDDTDNPANETACTQNWTGSIRVLWPDPPEAGDLNDIGPVADDEVDDAEHGVYVAHNVTAPLNSPVKVVTFNALGTKCTVDLTGDPCYPGPGPAS